MNKKKLVRHVTEHGCSLYRQGADHEFWRNGTATRFAAIPRHGEIKPGTVRAICRELGIPRPLEKERKPFMLHTPYGTTGVTVSRLGFGGMRFKDQKDEDACAGLVRACHDAGVTYFDTAPGYGESERLMGLVLGEMQKTRAEKPFYVSTKTFAQDPSKVREDLETSLKRLRLPHIDFYHLWCISNVDDYFNRKAALKVFEQLKSEGLIKHIVVSTHVEGSDVKRILDDYPFEGVLLGYSAMNFAYRDQGLTDAAKAKKGVVIMNPLGGGLIPRNPERFEFVKSRPEETVVEGALRFLLNDPRITVVLVGMSDLNDLKGALAAVDGFKPLGDAQVDRIRAGVKEAFNEICTGCGYCDDCPGELPIPKLMDAYNQFMLTGDRKNITNRLRMHWQLLPDGHNLDNCVECGKCEGECTQKLPIIKRLKEIRTEVDNWAAAMAAKNKKG